MVVVTYQFAPHCPIWKDLPKPLIVSLVRTRIRGLRGWFVRLEPYHNETWAELLKDPEVAEAAQRLNALVLPPYVSCPVTPKLGDVLEFAYFALKKRHVSFSSIWLLCSSCAKDEIYCAAKRAILSEGGLNDIRA